MDIPKYLIKWLMEKTLSLVLSKMKKEKLDIEERFS